MLLDRAHDGIRSGPARRAAPHHNQHFPCASLTSETLVPISRHHALFPRMPWPLRPGCPRGSTGWIKMRQHQADFRLCPPASAPAAPAQMKGECQSSRAASIRPAAVAPLRPSRPAPRSRPVSPVYTHAAARGASRPPARGSRSVCGVRCASSCTAAGQLRPAGSPRVSTMFRTGIPGRAPTAPNAACQRLQACASAGRAETATSARAAAVMVHDLRRDRNGWQLAVMVRMKMGQRDVVTSSQGRGNCASRLQVPAQVPSAWRCRRSRPSARRTTDRWAPRRDRATVPTVTQRDHAAWPRKTDGAGESR